MCRHFQRLQVIENEGKRKSRFSLSLPWEIQDGLIQSFLKFLLPNTPLPPAVRLRYPPPWFPLEHKTEALS